METAAHLAGLAGVALLGVPALHLDLYARRIARLRSLRAAIEDPALSESRNRLIRDLADMRDSWRHWKRFCLYGGLALAGAGQLLSLIRLW